MSFPRYPKYKASGVEWLGEVPEHWEVKRLRQVGRLLKGSGGSKEDLVETGVPCIRYGDLYTTFSFHITKARGFVTTERVHDYTPIEAGDVLFAASGEKLAEIGKSAVNLLGAPAVCGGDVVILRPDVAVDSRFLGFACDSPAAAMQKASMGRGTTVKHIYPDELRQVLLAFPPLAEQRAIAAFLDRETKKIDELVAEQERLIELLKEKRQAVISHAVTKGLDPAAPMKPSGVEWLGDVPAHWEVKRMKTLGAVRYGIGEPPKYRDEGTALIRATNVHAGRVNASGMVFVNPADIPTQRIVWLRPGDIIVVRSGAYTGDSAIIPHEYDGAIAGFDMVLRCASDVQPNFVQYGLLGASLLAQLELASTRAAQPHLNAEELGSCLLVLPPGVEQRAIALFLDRETEKIDTLVAQAESAIALLTERRSALISAAVTGRIDVRNAVPSANPTEAA